MRGKNTLITALAMFAILTVYMGYQQYKRHEAAQAMIRNAVAECKENLVFLNKCEAAVAATGNELAGMLAAQGDTKRQLSGGAIYGLTKEDIGREKKEAVTRISAEMDKYDTELAYAFYTVRGANMEQAYDPPTTGDMIKEFTTLEQMLEK